MRSLGLDDLVNNAIILGFIGCPVTIIKFG